MQTWCESIAEEATKQALSIPRIIFLQRVILPLFDIHVKFFENVGLSAIFSGAALFTNLFLRRLYNKLHFGNPQDWRQNLFEEGVKTGIGYLRLVILQPIVFTWFAIGITTGENWLIAAAFYLGVLITNFPLRMVFSWIEARKA